MMGLIRWTLHRLRVAAANWRKKIAEWWFQFSCWAYDVYLSACKKALMLWNGLDDFIVKNILDRHGRIDTGRIGQLFGLFLMYMFVKFIYIHIGMLDLSSTVEIANMLKLAGLTAGPGSILMMLYRLKDKWKTQGNPIMNDSNNGLPKGG